MHVKTPNLHIYMVSHRWQDLLEMVIEDGGLHTLLMRHLKV